MRLASAACCKSLRVPLDHEIDPSTCASITSCQSLLSGGDEFRRADYRDKAGNRITLYVSNELGDLAAPTGTVASTAAGKNAESSFRFAREGKVNVFYWVEGPFGYATSADAERAGLARVSGEVYRQLGSVR